MDLPNARLSVQMHNPPTRTIEGRKKEGGISWNKLQSDLAAYKVDEYLAIYQKYFDAFNAAK